FESMLDVIREDVTRVLMTAQLRMAPPPPPVENLMPRSPGALPPGHPPLQDPLNPPPLLPHRQ
ncbi:MAG TPA: hypothetical protein PLL18_07245, partial [Flavobacteriales bacterium]|nr:hypothetical protein [Flavobacteriales bacterium]